MTPPILEARGLHVSFNGVRAADDVSIAIHDGEFLAIIGPNGSGKTTLLNICTGYIRPRSGSVLLDGHDITHLSPRGIAPRRRPRIPDPATLLRTACDRQYDAGPGRNRWSVERGAAA